MIVLAEFPLETFLSYIGPDRPKLSVTIDQVEYHCNRDSLRLQCFLLSTSCACCGRRGNVWRLEKHKDSKKSIRKKIIQIPHFNLYSRSLLGKYVLMTHDHIVPRSKGGQDSLCNLQTMCFFCNQAKADTL